MTTIAAYLNDETGAVAIASDGLWISSIKVISGPKFRKYHPDGPEGSPIYIGWSGSTTVAQWFDDHARQGGLPEGDTETIARHCARWVAENMREKGWGKQDGRGDFSVSASGLLVRAGQRPWLLYGCGAALQPETPYAAVGTGSEVAMGVLWVVDTTTHSDVDTAVELALKAAIEIDPWTGGGPYVEVLQLAGKVVPTPKEAP